MLRDSKASKGTLLTMDVELGTEQAPASGGWLVLAADPNAWPFHSLPSPGFFNLLGPRHPSWPDPAPHSPGISRSLQPRPPAMAPS